MKDEDSICNKYDNIKRALKSISIVKSCLCRKQTFKNLFFTCISRHINMQL